MTGTAEPYELKVTGPVQRLLDRRPEGTAAAVVEFMLTALVEKPHRVGGRLRRELAELQRGAAPTG